MAKRNKNRAARREPQGGLRQTANNRSVSGGFARNVSEPYSFFRPDLSAFETINDRANARISWADTPATRPAARGTPSRQTPVRAYDTPSKRSLERKAERENSRPTVSDWRPQLLKRPSNAPAARKLERHEVRSARLEPSRPTCKSRPKDNRPKSGGSGKEFVPWCDRKS